MPIKFRRKIKKTGDVVTIIMRIVTIITIIRIVIVIIVIIIIITILRRRLIYTIRRPRGLRRRLNCLMRPKPAA